MDNSNPEPSTLSRKSWRYRFCPFDEPELSLSWPYSIDDDGVYQPSGDVVSGVMDSIVWDPCGVIAPLLLSPSTEAAATPGLEAAADRLVGCVPRTIRNDVWSPRPTGEAQASNPYALRRMFRKILSKCCTVHRSCSFSIGCSTRVGMASPHVSSTNVSSVVKSVSERIERETSFTFCCINNLAAISTVSAMYWTTCGCRLTRHVTPSNTVVDVKDSVG